MTEVIKDHGTHANPDDSPGEMFDDDSPYYAKQGYDDFDTHGADLEDHVQYGRIVMAALNNAQIERKNQGRARKRKQSKKSSRRSTQTQY